MSKQLERNISDNPFLGLNIDFEKETLSFSSDLEKEPVVVEFKPREFYYLQKLLRNYEKVSSKDELHPAEYAENLNTRSVDKHVSLINAKLKELFDGADYQLKIRAVRNEGYQIHATESAVAKNRSPFLLEGKMLFLENRLYEILNTLCDNFTQTVKKVDVGASPDVVSRAFDTNVSKLNNIFSKYGIPLKANSVHKVGYVLESARGHNVEVLSYDPCPHQWMLADIVAAQVVCKVPPYLFDGLTINFNEESNKTSISLDGTTVRFQEAKLAIFMTLLRQEEAQNSQKFSLDLTPHQEELKKRKVLEQIYLLKPALKELCKNTDYKLSVELRYSWDRKDDEYGSYKKGHCLTVKPKDVDSDKYQFEVDGHILELRYEEHKALNLLSQNFNGYVHGKDFGLKSKSLDQTISVVRKHFVEHGIGGYLEIKNTRGKGYCLKFKDVNQTTDVTLPVLKAEPYQEQKKLFLQVILPQLSSSGSL